MVHIVTPMGHLKWSIKITVFSTMQRRDDGFHVDWINTLLNNIHYNSFLSPHSHTVTKMVIRNLPRSTYSEFFRKFLGHILSSPNTNITPSGLTIHPEHPVFQGSNLDMVDRGVLGSWQCSWCPRGLKFETWHLQGLLYLQNVSQEHPVLQEYNLEMVDRGVLDSVPDVLETCNLKHDTLWAYSTSRLCVKNILSSKDPTWRWWTGVFLTVFLIS